MKYSEDSLDTLSPPKIGRTDEEKSIAQKIRNGAMPRSFFAKGMDGKLERSTPVNKKRSKLTWRLVGTFNALTKDLK